MTSAKPYICCQSDVDLWCFQSTLAASLIVAGGFLGAHAFNAAHSSLWPFAHAALCAFLEEYLANLHPVHLHQEPHTPTVMALIMLILSEDAGCCTWIHVFAAVHSAPVKLLRFLERVVTSRCGVIII